MDSTRLPERKTDHGNGVTRHQALIAGRYDEQGTTRTRMSSRIPQEATASVKARGYALRGDDDREERGTSRMSETKAPRSRQKLQKLHSYPAIRRTIKAWLKAGILEDGGFHETIKGTPQGGVVTPPTMLQNGPAPGRSQRA